jgi:CubicO group peptidase (beta-lactamase class C family)
VRDLLTFRMGFGIVLALPDAYPIQRAVSEQGVGHWPLSPSTPAPDEWIRRLGTLPLMHQPGEGWMYGTGSDVLGVLIARASGQPLETFLRERLFAPLRMKDTGFSVPADKLDRLDTGYQVNPTTGALEVYDKAEDSPWSRPPAFPSAGGGLVSTIDDYLAFGQMLLNKGKYGSERILSRPTVEAMTTDQLTPEQKAVAAPIIGNSSGWGFGLSIVTQHDSVAAPPGRYGWSGGLGTPWFSDPREEMVAILMTQRAWTTASPPAVCLDFWTSVYQAIDD